MVDAVKPNKGGDILGYIVGLVLQRIRLAFNDWIVPFRIYRQPLLIACPDLFGRGWTGPFGVDAGHL